MALQTPSTSVVCNALKIRTISLNITYNNKTCNILWLTIIIRPLGWLYWYLDKSKPSRSRRNWTGQYASSSTRKRDYGTKRGDKSIAPRDKSRRPKLFCFKLTTSSVQFRFACFTIAILLLKSTYNCIWWRSIATIALANWIEAISYRTILTFWICCSPLLW